MKTLIVFAPTMTRAHRTQEQQREAADESPRKLLLEDTLQAEVLDSGSLQTLPWLLRRLYKLLPSPVALALEAYRLRHRYDVVVSWDDRFALVYAFLLTLTRSRSRHVAIVSWMAPYKKGVGLRLFHRGIDRIIVWSKGHRDLLIELFSIPSSKIVEIPYFVDQQFWRPLNSGVEESICSAGDSKRDYATLIEAVRDVPINCSITTRVKPAYEGTGDWVETGRALASVPELPNNVILKPASPAELRAAYDRARFVVVPLVPSLRDHGVTTLAEAMAMGKAVICTRTHGVMEFLDEGINGISVPPHDPQALRSAIDHLLQHPDEAEQMGIEGRRRAEEIFALDRFAGNVRQVVDDVITGNRTSIPTMAEHLRRMAVHMDAIDPEPGLITAEVPEQASIAR